VIDVTVTTRLVVVLGRGSREADAAPYVGRAAERGVPLLVLRIGYPVSRSQGDFVAEAIDRAFDARVFLDAILLAEPAELATHLTTTDEVSVHAGRDRRRIASVVARLRP
jgi:hypothetical protein